MRTFTPVKQNPIVSKEKAYPSRRLRGLWRLNNPIEPMVTEKYGSTSGAAPLWYQSPDGVVGSVYYFAPDFFSDKAPLVVLLGPLLHPAVALKRTLPWIQAALADGQPVYAVSHRSHHAPSEEVTNKAACSFADIVEFDILSALDVINHHSGTHNVHLIGQDLGGILTLHLVTLIEQRRVQSVHLFNIPYAFPTSLKSTLLSFVHQDHTVRQVWSRHLHTGSLPSFVNDLSIKERSALLYSDTWLSKEWMKELRNNQTIETLQTAQNILLKQSFPNQLVFPIYIYSSLPEHRNSNIASWFQHPNITSLPKSVFPLLAETTFLSAEQHPDYSTQ